MLLVFDKPKKKMPVDAWKKQSFDGGPAGGYVPNMSEADAEKWKAKWVNIKTNPEIEIRKTIRGVQILIIVGRIGIKRRKGFKKGEIDDNVNVQISQNGTSGFSFSEFDELHTVVREAAELLFPLSRR